MSAEIHLGTQGWNYDAWVGPFYPTGTRPSEFLTVYARAFDSVEVDSTFYASPAEATIRSWAERTPKGFVFSLKLPQEITHEQRLRDMTGASETFFNRVRELGDKLGPVLVQTGPDFQPGELPALVDFIGHAPKDLRIAVEFRHRGWITDGVLALLREHNIALALVDGRWLPRKLMVSLATRPTADFAYIRWMGPNRDLVDYTRVQVDRSYEIELWSDAIGELAEKVGQIYGYVANTFSGHAPATVRELQYKLGQTPVDPDLLGEQMSLF
ncbi:MAG TPA: DUF72 domain-containing protein [Gemmatimonadaceae bacterium]|nr:DUF72 domain-containing protein [Gemmatimonadaceae bacterium]